MKPFIRVSEAARLLGCSSYTVRQLIVEGLLHGQQIKPRGWFYVSTKSLVEYAENNNLHLNWDSIREKEEEIA